MDRIKLLKLSLRVGALYYVIGGIAHFFGLTLFPWYIGTLYSVYHDTVIVLTSFVLSIIIFTVSKNPVKNIDVLNALIIVGFLAVLFSFYIIWKIDFTPATEAKRTQTIIELILLIIYLGVLVYLRPHSIKS